MDEDTKSEPGDREPRERRPLSCDISGHPWPPKFTTRPLRRRPPAPLPPPPPPEPLSPPTIENRIAAGAAILVAVLFFISGLRQPGVLLLGLPNFAYLGVLAFGAWRVRPRPRRGRAFFWWFLPILLQLAVYLLLTWHLALRAVAGPTPPASYDTPLIDSLSWTCLFAYLAGWVPATVLMKTCQRGGWLLVAETLGPVVTILHIALMIN